MEWHKPSCDNLTYIVSSAIQQVSHLYPQPCLQIDNDVWSHCFRLSCKSLQLLFSLGIRVEIVLICIFIRMLNSQFYLFNFSSGQLSLMSFPWKLQGVSYVLHFYPAAFEASIYHTLHSGVHERWQSFLELQTGGSLYNWPCSTLKESDSPCVIWLENMNAYHVCAVN